MVQGQRSRGQGLSIKGQVEFDTEGQVLFQVWIQEKDILARICGTIDQPCTLDTLYLSAFELVQNIYFKFYAKLCFSQHKDLNF